MEKDPRSPLQEENMVQLPKLMLGVPLSDSGFYLVQRALVLSLDWSSPEFPPLEVGVYNNRIVAAEPKVVSGNIYTGIESACSHI